MQLEIQLEVQLQLRSGKLLLNGICFKNEKQYF